MALLLAFIVAVSMNAVATIFLKIGSSKMPETFNLQSILGILTNYHILAGIFLYIASFPPYIYIFKKMNVSVGYPIFVSLSFATTAIIAFVFLKEHLTILQILGLLLVVGGIVLLATNGSPA